MTKRTQWLMLLALTGVLVFVVWRFNGPAIAKAMNIDPAKLHMPDFAMFKAAPAPVPAGVPAPTPRAGPQSSPVAAPTTQPASIAWLDDIAVGVATCRKTGKPVLILFTAQASPACEQLQSGLSTTRAAEVINEKFVAVKIDLDADLGGPHQQVANKFGVKAAPTMIVYGPAGKHVATRVGLPELGSDKTLGDATVRWMSDTLANAKGK